MQIEQKHINNAHRLIDTFDHDFSSDYRIKKRRFEHRQARIRLMTYRPHWQLSQFGGMGILTKEASGLHFVCFFALTSLTPDTLIEWRSDNEQHIDVLANALIQILKSAESNI